MIVFKKWPDPILTTPCESVKVFGRDIIKIADKLRFAMLNTECYGIAANQLGHNKAMFVYSYEKDRNKVIVNPKIRFKITTRDDDPIEEEGCLSIPGKTHKVKRDARILVSYMNLRGEYFREDIQGMKARIWQHEIDHLNGVSIIDRATKKEEIE